MNGSVLRIGGLIVLAAVAVLAYASTFVVSQTQQALVLRFGAVRNVVSLPGLYFKLPMIENVVYFDKRILDLDLPVQELIVSDRRRLLVDTFTRYRIDRPLVFYQTVGTVAIANLRLSTIVNSTTRTILARASFVAIIKTDRPALTKLIREEANEQARGLGLEIVDVRLRRVDQPGEVSKSVFDRMESERRREAAEIRAQGLEIGLGIRARADREVTVLLADANRTSEELRGQGDGERNRIFNEAFGRDQDFFAFYRSMQAYEAGLKSTDTRLVLSPDSDFFRYFSDPFGKSRNLASPGGAAGSAQPGAPARQ